MGADVGYIFVGSCGEVFLRFGAGVEWYVDAEISAVLTREVSVGVYRCVLAFPVPWLLSQELRWC